MSHLSSECSKSTHRLLRLNLICTCFVYTVTDVDGDPPVSLRCTCFVYTVTDVDGDPPVKLPLRCLHVYTQITKFDTTR